MRTWLCRMPMQHVGTDEDVGARRDLETAEFIGLDRAPGYEPARRIQPQGLQQYLVSKGHGLGGAEAE